MRFPYPTAAFAVVLGALPLAAQAASCNAPGVCDLVYGGGHWSQAAASGVVVTDGTRERSDTVIDGSHVDAVMHIVDSVMWTRSSDGENEKWTRAPRAAHPRARRSARPSSSSRSPN
jgi:hypothetical protein